jgi:hypothetical protein
VGRRKKQKKQEKSRMSVLRLKVVCIHPPVTPDETYFAFGLQDKDVNLTIGTPQADGSLTFVCEVTIKGTLDEGQPDFGGAFVHGKPAQRFLYLTLQRIGASGTREIVKRLKIGLHTITWAQVTQAQQLEVTVDGRGAASVPLLNGGWRENYE